MYERVSSEAETNDLEDEFLDLRINDYLPQFREENSKEYEIIIDIMNFLNSIVDNFGNISSQRDVYLISSIIELKRLFQSAIILFERGIPSAANIIIRSIMELSLNIVESVNNKEHIHNMLLNELKEAHSTIKLAEKINRLDLFPPETISGMQSHYSLLEGSDISRISVSGLARKNGLELEYLVYRSYCCNSHISASVLAENFKLSSSKITYEDGIRLDNFGRNVGKLIGIVIVPIPAMIEGYFNDEELKKQFDSLCEKYETVFK